MSQVDDSYSRDRANVDIRSMRRTGGSECSDMRGRATVRCRHCPHGVESRVLSQQSADGLGCTVGHVSKTTICHADRKGEEKIKEEEREGDVT